jgi:hypothetical protein
MFLADEAGINRILDKLKRPEEFNGERKVITIIKDVENNDGEKQPK